MTENETPLCDLCGMPMPSGEEMFTYHGYSGKCPGPMLPRHDAEPPAVSDARLLELWRSVQGPRAELTGPLIRFAAKVAALARNTKGE